MEITQFICRSDNFGILLHDEASGLTAAIDAPDAKAIREKLDQKGYKLDVLFITHHHMDHIEGITALKAVYGTKIIGPEREADKIGELDEAVNEQSGCKFANFDVKVLETPGHTLGSVCYYFPHDKLVFTGDTLFSLGCGRLFEGTAEMMFSSLEKLKALPEDTKLYCGHEYTKENARFARSVDPDNVALINRAAAVDRLIAVGETSLPSSIKSEKAANPFLRCDDPDIRKTLKMENASDVAVFAELRKRKDHF
ncbi:hydroxyacylglutathione hydrolase [uncultured Bartonella sp.]|uniref:hydroxyacylglutathione hydrolase n=1 Tax=uncultured Bartonella sp. TaxID=104108 RepID=UPI0025D4DA51|nr:hydroxyacylglutathione hydrolase [uncultured Bartonella sp.]